MEHTQASEITFDVDPSAYRHWELSVDAPVATLTLRVTPDAGLRDDYELKLNSYDLSVDIELHDIVQRLRFEHPEVHAVVVTGGIDKVFCAGANIQMLAGSTHAHKVNFCKFTNETRELDRGCDGALRSGLDRCRQRHCGGRWVRAGAGVRRDRADRRPGLDGLAPRGAAAGSAARYRRTDPRRGQALRPARPRRRLRHARRRVEGSAGARVGTRRRHRRSRTVRRGRARARVRRGRAPRTGRPTPEGWCWLPWTQRSRPTPGTTRSWTWRSIDRSAPRTSPSTLPPGHPW